MGLLDRLRGPRVRKVYWQDRDGPTLAATFRMEGEELRVEWSSESARRMLEVGGIVAPNTTEVLTPKDGRRFYDALPLALARASRVTVKDESPEPAE